MTCRSVSHHAYVSAALRQQQRTRLYPCRHLHQHAPLYNQQDHGSTDANPSSSAHPSPPSSSRPPRSFYAPASPPPPGGFPPGPRPSNYKGDPRRKLLKTENTRMPDDNPDDKRYQWKVGMILERPPRYLKPIPAWEQEWNEYLEKRPQEIPFPEELTPPPEPEPELKLVETVTEDDRNNNLRSLERTLDDSLFLLMKHPGNDRWVLPSVDWDPSLFMQMPLKQVATDGLRQNVGDELHFHTLGGAPVFYHRYHYTEEYRTQKQTQHIGVKLFVYHALWLSGNVTLPLHSAPYTDYVWVTKKTLHEYLPDPALVSTARDVLLLDSDYDEEVTDEEMHAREMPWVEEMKRKYRKRYQQRLKYRTPTRDARFTGERAKRKEEAEKASPTLQIAKT